MGVAPGRFAVRVISFLGAVALMTALSACLDRESAGDSGERQDPAEFAAELYGHGADGQWDEVSDRLVEPFDTYDGEQLQRGLAFPRWSENLSEAAGWQATEHDGFSIARSEENPQQALVLEPDGEGSWRYDPGDRALMLIERRIKGIERPGLPRETNGMPEDAPYQSMIESDARASDIHPHVQRQLGPVIPGNESIEVTLHMTLQEAEEVRLPLAGIRAATPDGSTLDTQLTGTTAVVENGIASMPVPAGDRAAYRVSLAVERPADADAFALEFPDLEIVGPRGNQDSTLEFDLHYADVSVQTLPEFLDD